MLRALFDNKGYKDTQASNDWLVAHTAMDEVTALMIKGLLNDADIPVVIHQSGSSAAIPGIFPSGPRKILVPESVLLEAKELIRDTVDPRT